MLSPVFIVYHILPQQCRTTWSFYVVFASWMLSENLDRTL